jgi:integrase
MEMELREGIAKLVSVPKGRRDVLVWDTKTPGFFLRKYSTGRAMWGVRYHVGTKQRRVHLYDAAVRGTLAKARSEAADVRAKARLGTDVVAERRVKAEATARTITLGKLAERYLADRRDAWRPRYYMEVERHLKMDWQPLANLAIDAITRLEIVRVIDDIATGQGRVAADRARSALSGLYTWAIDRSYLDATPVIHMRPRASNGPRERTLSAEELREVWLGVDGVGGDYGRIVRLLILTGQRREEIGLLAWTEIQTNGDGIRIELPGERTKNHRPHVVPLSAAAAALLPPRPNTSDRIMVFGRVGTGFSGWSKAKSELDAALATARKKRGVKAMSAWRLHDLRRTFVTMVGELGFAPPHVIEAIINHVSGHKAGVAGTYNKALYLEERRKALEVWGRHLEELVR